MVGKEAISLAMQGQDCIRSDKSGVPKSNSYKF